MFLIKAFTNHLDLQIVLGFVVNVIVWPNKISSSTWKILISFDEKFTHNILNVCRFVACESANKINVNVCVSMCLHIYHVAIAPLWFLIWNEAKLLTWFLCDVFYIDAMSVRDTLILWAAAFFFILDINCTLNLMLYNFLFCCFFLFRV